MYRGITISPVISKVFELLLISLYDNFLTSDTLQYGFKNSVSTHALFTVNETEIFNKKRIKSLVASKAFDKVLHNGIFKKLLERGIPVSFVYLLRYWYSNLQCRVQLGDLFPVFCGVRQGGVLSPVLFAFYIDGFISE